MKGRKDTILHNCKRTIAIETNSMQYKIVDRIGVIIYVLNPKAKIQTRTDVSRIILLLNLLFSNEQKRNPEM